MGQTRTSLGLGGTSPPLELLERDFLACAQGMGPVIASASRRTVVIQRFFSLIFSFIELGLP